ncbi:MAG: orotate phosphoribosyltransferase [Acidobacteriota bacterium]
MSDAKDWDELKALLLQRSLAFGDFVLTSGKRSNYYFDSKITTLHPRGIYLAARAILGIVREQGLRADAVGGLTLGADPLVSGCALVSQLEGPYPLQAFIVRKEPKGHGSKRLIEGLWEKDTVRSAIIVEDVCTTGSSSLKAVEAAEEYPMEVKAVIALVDREEGGSERIRARYPFFPVFRRSDLFT